MRSAVVIRARLHPGRAADRAVADRHHHAAAVLRAAPGHAQLGGGGDGLGAGRRSAHRAQSHRTRVAPDPSADAGRRWRRAVFAGDAEALEWVAPLSDHVGIPGLYILRLSLEEAGEYPRLVLTRWLLHDDVLNDGNEHPAWEPLMESTGSSTERGSFDRDLAQGAYGRTLLLPRVARFQLEYFGRSQAGFEREWSEEWIDQRALPQAVRLTLSTPEQQWPAALVRLPGLEVMRDQDR